MRNVSTKLIQSSKPLNQLLTEHWAKGFTVQQSFSAARSAGVSVSYQQVVNFHTTKAAVFEGSFSLIFGDK
jgi:hypothetical protein